MFSADILLYLPKHFNLYNMEEIWKYIQGYEGLYQISNLGRVKSLNYNHTKKEKILQYRINERGYKYISLCVNNIRKSFKIHRLVAEAFIPNPHNYPCINHKDEDKTNNCVDNLEWCTYKYNSNYGTAIKRRVANTDYKAIVAKIDYKAIAAKIDYKEVSRKRVANTDYKARTANTDYKAIARKNAEKLLNRKDQSKPVLQYTKDGEFVKEYKSTRECGRNGFNQSNVVSCCNGKLKTCGGFIWKYKE